MALVEGDAAVASARDASVAHSGREEAVRHRARAPLHLPLAAQAYTAGAAAACSSSRVVSVDNDDDEVADEAPPPLPAGHGALMMASRGGVLQKPLMSVAGHGRSSDVLFSAGQSGTVTLLVCRKSGSTDGAEGHIHRVTAGGVEAVAAGIKVENKKEEVKTEQTR